MILRLIQISGTRTYWKCPEGHITVRDYGRGPVSRRLTANSVRLLARVARWEDGAYGDCAVCRRQKGK